MTVERVEGVYEGERVVLVVVERVRRLDLESVCHAPGVVHGGGESLAGIGTHCEDCVDWKSNRKKRRLLVLYPFRAQRQRGNLISLIFYYYYHSY